MLRASKCSCGGYRLALKTVRMVMAKLRGLADKTYRVVGYANGRDYGSVKGPVAKLAADFTGSLLLEASPSQ